MPAGPLFAGGLLLAVASGLGGYVHGLETGSLREREEQRKALDAATAARDRLRSQIEQAALLHLQADQLRQTTNREIVRESSQIIERPVYRNRCVDADGVRLLDRAAVAANGEPAPAPAGQPAKASPGAPGG